MDYTIEALHDTQRQLTEAERRVPSAADQQQSMQTTLGWSGTETAELLRMREQERQLKSLLDDCYALIHTYSNDLDTRPDQYNLRYGQTSEIIERIKRVFGPTYQSVLMPPRWTQNDVLLLLQRVQDKEKQLYDAEERKTLLLQEMMQVENERDKAQRQQKEAEDKLREKEREVDSLKLQQKSDTWNTYKPNAVKTTPLPTATTSTTPYTYSSPLLNYSSPIPSVLWNIIIYRINHTQQEIEEVINRVRKRVLNYCTVY